MSTRTIRRYSLEPPPPFRQVVMLVTRCQQADPTLTLPDLVDAAKYRHLSEGYHYDPETISQAVRVVFRPRQHPQGR